MLANVFTRSVGERLRSTVLYAVALAAASAMYIGLFPSFEGQMAGYAEVLPDAMKAFMGDDFGSPEGYVHSTIFGVFGPVLFVAAAITAGAAAVAGEEERHTLPLLLSTPLPRMRLGVQKAGALLVLLTGLAAVLFVTLVGVAAGAGVAVGAGGLLAATVHLHALAVFAAGLAFGIGAATGRRALALGVAAATIVAGYVMAGMAGMVEGLDVLRLASPYAWYNGTVPVKNGFAVGHLALLYGAGAVTAAAGLWRFDRRDLTG